MVCQRNVRLVVLIMVVAYSWGSGLYKIDFTQTNYPQFMTFETKAPPMRELMICAWYKPRNITYDQIIFSYSRGSSIMKWWFTRSGRLMMTLLGQLVADSRLGPLIRPGQWSHLCAGLDTEFALWAFYLDSSLVSYGQLNQISGWLPSGGHLFAGQDYTALGTSWQEGLEGELFGLSLVDLSHSLPPQQQTILEPRSSNPSANQEGRSPGRRGFSQSLNIEEVDFGQKLSYWSQLVAGSHMSCLAGEPLPWERAVRLVISWTSTPARLFGGASLLEANPICANF